MSLDGRVQAAAQRAVAELHAELHDAVAVLSGRVSELEKQLAQQRVASAESADVAARRGRSRRDTDA